MAGMSSAYGKVGTKLLFGRKKSVPSYFSAEKEAGNQGEEGGDQRISFPQEIDLATLPRGRARYFDNFLGGPAFVDRLPLFSNAQLQSERRALAI